jgi:hypothetical protein
MTDHVKQAIFIQEALLEAEAAALALPQGPQRRALIAAHRRLHARLYGGLTMIEESYPGLTTALVPVTPDSGGTDKNISFAEGVGPQAKQAA